MEETSEGPNLLKIFTFNLIFEFILTVIMLFILALLLSMTSLEETIISPSIIGITTFSILLGGFITSRKIKSKGIVIGVIQGFIYMLVLYLTSSFMNMDFSLNLQSLTMIGIGMLGGAIGGIIGVNIK